MKSANTVAQVYLEGNCISTIPLADVRVVDNKEHIKLMEGFIPLNYINGAAKLFIQSPPLVTFPISDITDLDVIPIGNIYQ